MAAVRTDRVSEADGNGRGAGRNGGLRRPMPEGLDVFGVEDDDYCVGALIDRHDNGLCARQLNGRARGDTGRFDRGDRRFGMSGDGRVVARCTTAFVGPAIRLVRLGVIARVIGDTARKASARNLVRRQVRATVGTVRAICDATNGDLIGMGVPIVVAVLSVTVLSVTVLSVTVLSVTVLSVTVLSVTVLIAIVLIATVLVVRLLATSVVAATIMVPAVVVTIVAIVAGCVVAGRVVIGEVVIGGVVSRSHVQRGVAVCEQVVVPATIVMRVQMLRRRSGQRSEARRQADRKGAPQPHSRESAYANVPRATTEDFLTGS